MSETRGEEAVGYGEKLTEEMQLSNDGKPAVLDSPPPSTAASTVDTIDSKEEAHYCDEWELFSDTKSDVPDDDESANDHGAEIISQLDSNWQQTSTELAIESAVFVNRSQQDDSGRQEDSALAPVNSVDSDPVVLGSMNDEHRLVKENTDGSMRQKIQVVVRVRPPSDSEGKIVVTVGEKEGSSLCVQATTAQGSINTVTECAFDRVFMGAATQEDVFAAIEPSLQACLEGYNATVFAYGQTGTGKTHTLFGRDLGSPRDKHASEDSAESFRMVKSSWGIAPRTLSYLLDRAAILKEKNCQVDLHLSFLQIYNDRLFDLLTDRMRQKPLLIREQPTLEGMTCVTVQGLSSVPITSFSNAMQIIHQGHTNRCVRETESNLSSSRSHAIVQLHVTTQCRAPNGDGQVIRRARLNLVDLAGSEKWNTDIEMEDAHSQELKNINTSLSALGNCIAALTEAGRKHIPYRDSTLTRVLQDSFGGNTQSCLIATVNATEQSYDETIRTLHFADRAKSVMQTIRVNEVADGSTELLMAKIQIAKLRERLESDQGRRHEARLKEHQALQRDFQEKLKGKDKEITKLLRDNAVFQRWRDEDVKKIRALETRVKDLEQLIESNGGKSSDSSKDLATNSSTQGPNRLSTLPVSTASVTRYSALHKTRSRSSLIRVGSDSGAVARTYKEVIERYTLGSTRGQEQKRVETGKATFEQDLVTDLSYKETNQLENPEASLSLHLDSPSNSIQQLETTSNSIQQWETMTGRNRADEPPSLLGTTEVAWRQASGLCVPPVVGPPDIASGGAAAQSSSTTNSWKCSSLTAASKNVNPDWISSVLSKSTPSLLTQKQENYTCPDKPRSSDLASGYKTPASKQELVTLMKSVHGGNFNYNSPSDAHVACAIGPCLKHKLAGCMLCSVDEGFRQSQVQAANATKKAILSTVTWKAIEVTHKPQDGPCERHQLLRCFICMKGIANSTPTSAVQTPTMATNVTSAYSYSNVAISSHGMFPNYQTPASHAEVSAVQAKCALHSLANCILCAGVKAMTRKVVVPPQPSPSKMVTTFDARAVNHAEDRAVDRYRRYTLDERILSYHPTVANQW
ncbi:unnamed protein product [Phytophthora fragariaefolia]|uniref:Unnamed protein product n=1 Tax=Phytophthora fragariaefolia TaxID=1490495 RepID=A0A9W6XM83_9STRA|nr:unnamed protein product [Phytophthora fragariaefolia]